MAFQAKDGSKHTNKDSQKRADAKHAARTPAERSPEAGAPDEPLEQQGMEEPEQQGEQQQESGAAIAAQHGPASIIDIQHDPATGQSQVNSMHPSGHQHSSVHADPHSAHKHAMELAGCAGGEMQ